MAWPTVGVKRVCADSQHHHVGEHVGAQTFPLSAGGKKRAETLTTGGGHRVEGCQYRGTWEEPKHGLVEARPVRWFNGERHVCRVRRCSLKFTFTRNSSLFLLSRKKAYLKFSKLSYKLKRSFP